MDGKIMMGWIPAGVLVLGFTFAMRVPNRSTTMPLPNRSTAEIGFPVQRWADDPHRLFRTSSACMACHNGLVTPDGEDVSIGVDWRASMMANSARDPYWQAAVRREITDHPGAQAEIERECSTCHMPMAHVEAIESGRAPEVFAHLPVREASTEADHLAADGVSCTTCHQIADQNLGQPESFTGGFVIDTESGVGQRRIFGPYEVDEGRVTIMRSASEFRPTQGAHLQRSELCATCHTLYTKTLGAGGEVIGELPEQVPFLEWQHSAYRDEQNCQSCHMPVVPDSTAITAVLGQPRSGFSRHSFRGGNFFMLRMLNRYRDELGVAALPNELDASVDRTRRHLQESTARLRVEAADRLGDRLEVTIQVENLAGHKLPTAYPSRRVWIHLSVVDGDGDVVFESGALRPDGSIVGNDNDDDPRAYEPHYAEIDDAEQVQIYEPILVGPDELVTTGLLTAVRYAKDNRLLPDGFEKASAADDVAVRGAAAGDPDFTGGSDRVRYRIDVTGGEGPFTVRAALWYQPIGFRWAHNLEPYDEEETRRFVRYFDAMSGVSGMALASAEATSP